MTTGQSSASLAPLASAATVEEAEIIRARLGADGIQSYIPNAATTEWLPHMSSAINPYGVMVLVATGDLEKARELLKPAPPEENEKAFQPVSNDANVWARRASRSAILSWLFLPLVAWSAWCLLKASAAKEQRPPIDLARYKRDRFAALLLALPMWGVVVLIVSIVGGDIFAALLAALAVSTSVTTGVPH